jgi:translation initiation factor 4B
MAAKKGKKNKVVLSLSEFHAITPTEQVSSNANSNSGGGGGGRMNWADEMEKLDDGDSAPPSDFVFDRSQLPTAAKSTLDPDLDLASIPKQPPFTAHLSNVSFEADEEKLKAFFKDLVVLNVRMPVDEGNRSKGFAYVEFADRESLIAALTRKDTNFNKRPIKITLDEPKSSGSYGDRRMGGGRDNQRDDGPLKSDEADWRRPSAEPSSQHQESDWSSGRRDNSYQQRGGGSGGGDRSDYMQRNNQNDYSSYNQNRDHNQSKSYGQNRYNQGDRHGGGGAGGGGGYQRRGDGYQQRGGASGYGNRENNEGYNNQNRSGGGGGGSEPDFKRNERTYESSSSESAWKTQPAVELEQPTTPTTSQVNVSHENTAAPIAAAAALAPATVGNRSPTISTTELPKERPKLNLAPRTIPVEESGQVASASSIFGSAKPVNTAAKEKEIEERLKKERDTNNTEKKTTSTSESTHSDQLDKSHDGNVSESHSQRSHKTSFTSNDGRDPAMSPHQHGSPSDQEFQTVGGNRQRRDNRDKIQSNRMPQSNSFQNKPNQSGQQHHRQPQRQHKDSTDASGGRPAGSAWTTKPAADLFNDQHHKQSSGDPANSNNNRYNNNDNINYRSQQNRPASNRDNNRSNNRAAGGDDRKFSRNDRNQRSDNNSNRNFNNNNNNYNSTNNNSRNNNNAGSDRQQFNSNYDNHNPNENNSLGITQNKFANLDIDVEGDF